MDDVLPPMFQSPAEALAALLASISASLGADDAIIVEDGRGLLAFEIAESSGTSAFYLARAIVSENVDVNGEVTYTADLTSDAALLSAHAVSGTLDLIDVRVRPEPLMEPEDEARTMGYDTQVKLNYESMQGTERTVIYLDDNGTSGLPMAVFDRDANDVRGTAESDTVFLGDGGFLRTFKGADIVVSDGDSTIYGGSGNDVLQGGDGDDRLFGNQNDDTIYSGAGVDYVDGGTGDDEIFMGRGVFPDQNEVFSEARGGKGNDVLTSLREAHLYGGQGEDTLYGGSSQVGPNVFAQVTLAGGDGADTIYGGQDAVIYGGKSNDILHVSSSTDAAFGGSGNDTFFAKGYGGELTGGSGNDVFYGGIGGDDIFGGDGNDVIQGTSDEFSTRLNTRDEAFGGNGHDTITDVYYGYGGAGRDTLTGLELFGGKGDDTLTAIRQFSTLNGGAGDDILSGNTEVRDNPDIHYFWDHDTINGGDGEDTIYGHWGDDELRGGHDDDVLTGGAGHDTFGFGDDGSTDVVTDFVVGEDVIELVNFDGDLTFDDLFLSQDDSVAVIEAGDAVIRLENVDVDDLDADDFII